MEKFIQHEHFADKEQKGTKSSIGAEIPIPSPDIIQADTELSSSIIEILQKEQDDAKKNLKQASLADHQIAYLNTIESTNYLIYQINKLLSSSDQNKSDAKHIWKRFQRGELVHHAIVLKNALKHAMADSSKSPELDKNPDSGSIKGNETNQEAPLNSYPDQDSHIHASQNHSPSLTHYQNNSDISPSSEKSDDLPYHNIHPQEDIKLFNSYLQQRGEQVLQVNGDEMNCLIRALLRSGGHNPSDLSFENHVDNARQLINNLGIEQVGDLLNAGDESGHVVIAQLRSLGLLNERRGVSVYTLNNNGEVQAREVTVGDPTTNLPNYFIILDQQHIHFYGVGPIEQHEQTSYRSTQDNSQAPDHPPEERRVKGVRARDARRSEALKKDKAGEPLNDAEERRVKGVRANNAKKSVALRKARDGEPLNPAEERIVKSIRASKARSNARRSEALKKEKAGKPLDSAEDRMVKGVQASNARRSEALKKDKAGEPLNDAEERRVKSVRASDAKKLAALKKEKEDKNKS